MGSEVEIGSFIYDGHRLSYEVHGEGDRVLLYMHGLLMDAEMNRGVARALALRGHRVVLLDLLGHGRSDKPTHASAYRMDVYAQQVVACLDHLGVDQAVIGGASLGANVSLQVAIQARERMRAMVIEMPVLEWATPAAALAFVPLLLGIHYLEPVAAAVTGLMRRVPRTPIGPLNSVLNSLSLPPEVMAAVLHGILVGPVTPTIEERGAIDVPTLVLAHSNDVIHPFSDAQNLVDQLPDAELVRAHSLVELRLQPLRLTTEVARFLDRVWEPSAVRD